MIRCLTDPTLRTLDTEVVSCSPAGPRFAVVLSDTILYPEGGGQPADHGRIGTARVSDVQTVDGAVVHTTDRAVEPGKIRVEVDWMRRFDHMQQHTAQHLLTAMAQDRYGWMTTSFHLGADRCDIEIDTAVVGETEILALEAAINAEIRAARPVGITVVDRAGYADLDVRSRGVPDGVDAIRLIEIEGIDLNTCGGTHVANTAQLGRIQLLGTEKIRGGLRLFFVAGDRVGTHLRRALDREAALSKVLSSGPSDHVSAVEKLLADARAAGKAQRSVQGELAGLLGAALGHSDAEVLTLHRDNADMGFLNQVASAAAAIRPETPMLLTAGEPDGVFLVVASAAKLTAMKAEILDLLGGRGGGPPGRLQGRGTRIDRRKSVVEVLLG